MDTHQIIITPINTEKIYSLQPQGKYAFRVNSRATKIDVKNAIKAAYGVNVTEVNIINIRPKSRLVRRGMLYTKRQGYKRALVTLEKGKKIDITKLTAPKKK